MPKLNAEKKAANSSPFETRSSPTQKGAASLLERKALFAQIAQSGIPQADRDAYFVELARRVPEKSLVRICGNLRELGEEASWLYQIFSLELQGPAPEEPKLLLQTPATAVAEPPAKKKPKTVVIGITDGKAAIRKAKQHFSADWATAVANPRNSLRRRGRWPRTRQTSSPRKTWPLLKRANKKPGGFNPSGLF